MSMGQFMSFLFNHDCVEQGAAPIVPPVMRNEDSKPLARALVQAIIYEKNQHQAPNLSGAESLTKYLLKNYEEIEPEDLNALYEHSDEALFKREMESEHELSRSFSYSVTCMKQTLLTLAARYSSSEVFLKLLSHSDIDPNVSDEEGDAPLHIAAKLGRMNIVACLVQDPRTNIDKKDGHGRTARRLSITNRYVEIEELIVKASADQTEAHVVESFRSGSGARP